MTQPQSRRHSRNQEKSGAGCVSRVEERNRDRPQPWILLKSMVLFVLALIGFSAYTYIGRFILPGLRQQQNYPFSRVTCIGLLAGYCIVLLMFLWTYARVVITGPGFAADHVEKSPIPSRQASGDTVPGQPYHQQPQPQPPADPHLNYDAGQLRSGHGYPPPPRPRTGSQSAAVPQGPMPGLQRIVNPEPVLRPEYRYCYREGLIKPHRTHHCRACGKCVLAYDHHCPWIGQCVGAHNARYFFVFVEWVFVYTTYVFVSLVFSLVRTQKMDGPQIAIVILTGLFIMFSIGMLGTHTRLTLLNQTTVESMSRSAIREQDRATMEGQISCWDASTRRAVVRRWDAEWGNPDTEGNMWWLGSSSANWRQRMGDNPIGWFLPLATHNPSGLDKDYPVNPRFSDQGLWRRREEWPAEYR